MNEKQQKGAAPKAADNRHERKELAKAAMIGLIARGHDNEARVASSAVKFADALIAELGKSNAGS